MQRGSRQGEAKAVGRSLKTIVRRHGWAIWSKTGHVCVNAEGMPAVFFRRKQAVQFRDELIPHIGKGKVFRAILVVSSNDQDDPHPPKEKL